MQNAILHPEPYTSGEEWVLGPPTGAPVRLAPPSPPNCRPLPGRLPGRLAHLPQDRARRPERHICRRQRETPPARQPLLRPAPALPDHLAEHRRPNPAFSEPFQAPQSVVPPRHRGLARRAPPTSRPLRTSKARSTPLLVHRQPERPQPPPAPVLQPLQAPPKAAVSAVRGGFTPPDPTGNMDSTSEALLRAPIKSSRRACQGRSRRKAAGGGAQVLVRPARIPCSTNFPSTPSPRTDAICRRDGTALPARQGALAKYALNRKRQTRHLAGQHLRRHPRRRRRHQPRPSCTSSTPPRGSPPPSSPPAAASPSSPSRSTRNPHPTSRPPPSISTAPPSPPPAGQALHLEVFALQHHPLQRQRRQPPPATGPGRSSTSPTPTRQAPHRQQARIHLRDQWPDGQTTSAAFPSTTTSMSVAPALHCSTPLTCAHLRCVIQGGSMRQTSDTSHGSSAGPRHLVSWLSHAPARTAEALLCPLTSR